jgi:hypothetical protein
MAASEKLRPVEGMVTEMPLGADTQYDSGIVDNPVQPEERVMPENITVLPSLAAIKETRVKNYDPKRLFGPFTPAQMSLYDSLVKIIPGAYPSKASLSKARAREICYMGGRAINALPHVSAMKQSELH